jgi:hypothetical protein
MIGQPARLGSTAGKFNLKREREGERGEREREIERLGDITDNKNPEQS